MTYRFLIYISYSYSVPIGKPLEAEIKKRDHIIRWFADVAETRTAIADLDSLDTVDAAVDFNPHIVLTATDRVAHFIPGIKVQIFHGFNAQKRQGGGSHFKIRGFFDLYCTQGPSTTLVFKEQQKKKGHFDVIETGWSKVDPLFPLDDIKIKEKPVLLIASTFSRRLSLAHNDAAIAAIRGLRETGKYMILCVLHPKMDPQRVDRFKAMEGKDFRHIDTTDLTPLFKEADLMIADTTSAILEFLLQKKPVVTINNALPGPHLVNITDPGELQKAVEDALSHPPQLLRAIEEFTTWIHPYTDGKSSARVVDACIDFLHAYKTYLKKKPFNLIRKFKVRRLLNDFRHKGHNRPITLAEK